MATTKTRVASTMPSGAYARMEERIIARDQVGGA